MAGVPIDLNADVGEGLDVADEALCRYHLRQHRRRHAGDLRLAAVQPSCVSAPAPTRSRPTERDGRA